MIVAETGLFPGDLAEGKRGLSVSSFTSFRRVARKGDLGQISQISKVFYLTYKDDAICIKSSAARSHLFESRGYRMCLRAPSRINFSDSQFLSQTRLRFLEIQTSEFQ
ncbi:MAG: hypothetical protein EZS28_011994 [Streblomastix strix]|uniref:Uncharacterized protein n=1 Tax=Streblomastix strix TaxID=222440 RepID=A0A5J4WBZ7_9EUKA|nr:MAG: hypothetical protein EZS28_011994 [Streblomastix strix]